MSSGRLTTTVRLTRSGVWRSNLRSNSTRWRGKAGYALSGFTVSRAGRQDLVLRFRHDSDLGPEERLTAMRELKELGMMDARPELSLVRILLDATDWRDAGTGTRFELTGVEVHVGDAVS